jgi:hypothetical protein
MAPSLTAIPISSATMVFAIENDVRRCVSVRPYWYRSTRMESSFAIRNAVTGCLSRY